MSRVQIIASFAAIWLTAFLVDSAQAQTYPARSQGVHLTGGIQPALLPPQNNATVAQPISSAHPPHGHHHHPGHTHGYPQTGAALYPAPQPYIPYQVGGTMITNQALYPHEMLYPHRYKAMYPPFYYVVEGNWYLTPWGVRNSEVWKLAGTTVDVKYRSKISPFSGFNPVRR